MDIADFSPASALAGGALIGAGAALLMLTNGRIMGVAGIVGTLVGEPKAADNGWRLAFAAGMVMPAAILGLIGHFDFAGPVLALPLVLLAGFLVGFGARMGNGCTSGHGICGLSRLSVRSIAAVLTFMAVAAITVAVSRHLLGG